MFWTLDTIKTVVIGPQFFYYYIAKQILYIFLIKSKSDQKCLVFTLCMCILLVNLHFLVPRYQYHGFRYIPRLKERAAMVYSNSAKNLRFLRVKPTLSSLLGFEIKLLENI